MSIDYQIGDQAKLYYHATPETALAAMTELAAVKDVTPSMSRGLADLTTRANSGWRKQVPVIGEMTLEFTLLWSDSAAVTAIRDAFLNRTTIDFCAMSGDRDVAGHNGPRGSFFISEFSRDEPLEDGLTHSVTAVLSVYHAWETATT